MKKRLISLLLALTMLFSLSTTAFAEGADDNRSVAGYVVLGADLSAEQQATVLDLLGITDLSQYAVSTTTHEEEVSYFGDYLSSEVLGSKALSSILLVPGEEGSGISINLKNISFCTEEMFQSALVDAGVEDVTVTVAGPVELSGTCALTSAMKAYSLMTGTELDEDAADAAVNEIATTVAVAEELSTDSGSDDASSSATDANDLIAALKQEVLRLNLSEDDIEATLDDLCESMGVTLSDATKREIINLMLKLKDVDIDFSKLQEQAADFYDKLSQRFDLGVDKQGFLDSIGNFFTSMLQGIVNFLKGVNRK